MSRFVVQAARLGRKVVTLHCAPMTWNAVGSERLMRVRISPPMLGEAIKRDCAH